MLLLQLLVLLDLLLHLRRVALHDILSFVLELCQGLSFSLLLLNDGLELGLLHHGLLVQPPFLL